MDVRRVVYGFTTNGCTGINVRIHNKCLFSQIEKALKTHYARKYDSLDFTNSKQIEKALKNDLQRLELSFQHEVLEAALLLDVVDGGLELVVQLVLLLLHLREALLQHLVLPEVIRQVVFDNQQAALGVFKLRNMNASTVRKEFKCKKQIRTRAQ